MTATNTYWVKDRDKYGRVNYRYISTGANGGTAGVVVKMPRTYTAKYPDRKYLANDWRLADRDAAVTYHTTLAAAKAALAAA